MKAIVLLSGGMDSAVALRSAFYQELRDVVAVTFDYQQHNQREVGLAHVQARAIGVPWMRVDVDTVALEGFGLVGGTIERGRSVAEISSDSRPSSLTPGRNTIFLAHALAIAETMHAEEIWIGANNGDRIGYPDCRPAFFEAFEALTDALGTPIKIRAPLIFLTKREVVLMGTGLGVDFNLTSSCYLGTECGECDACVLRNHALGQR